jgi:TonB family protein
MKNNAFIGGLFLLAVATGAFGQAVAPQEVEDALTTELKDKILTLRAFYPDERLRFVADGRYLGESTPRSWTLWANIAVASVAVKRESLVLQGERIFAVPVNKGHEFQNVRSKKKVKVQIDFAGEPITVQSAHSALAKIFLSKNERLSSFVPLEWQQMVRQAEEPQTLHSSVSPAGQQQALKVGTGITPPRVVFSPDPFYEEEARRVGYQGTVVLWIVLDERGKISDLRIARPLGMGLDERAIEAVRRWRFEPAKKDGVPVRIQLNIEVNFHLWRGP